MVGCGLDQQVAKLSQSKGDYAIPQLVEEHEQGWQLLLAIGRPSWKCQASTTLLIASEQRGSPASDHCYALLLCHRGFVVLQAHCLQHSQL